MRIKFAHQSKINRRSFPNVNAATLWIAFVIAGVYAPTQVADALSSQQVSANQQEQTTKQEKETTTVITGTVVNQRSLPVKGQALELYMVVNGVARDAYGAPLKSAVTIGPKRQILGLMMFPVKSQTDAAGKFSMELPKYMLVPSGLEMTGWTVVGIDASDKVSLLTVKGEMVTVAPKPDISKIDLGKLSLQPPVPR